MTRDVLERLREADPLVGQPSPDPSSDQARALLSTVLAGAPTPLARARRRRQTVTAVVAAAAVLATAAAIAVTTRRVADPLNIGCYDAASTSANTVVVAATGPNPVAACRELWEQGVIDPEVGSSDAVPDLVACVLDSADVVGVFPAASCDDVLLGETTDEDGLRPVAPQPEGTPSEVPTSGLSVPDFGTDDETVRAAMDEVRLAMLDRCLALDEATRLVRDTLAAHDLHGWTVEPVLPDHPPDACTGFFPQPADRHVGLVPEVDGPRDE
jgi:hypothetical protein